jgi:hypothetical protein
MKDLWDKLNGYKTAIAVIAWGVIQVALGEGWMTTERADVMMKLVYTLGGIGVIHKGSKLTDAIAGATPKKKP